LNTELGAIRLFWERLSGSVQTPLDPKAAWMKALKNDVVGLHAELENNWEVAGCAVFGGVV
jgi:hypothetical protein